MKSKIDFYITNKVSPSEAIYISGNCDEFGNNQISKALKMDILEEDNWFLSVEVDPSKINTVYLEFSYSICKWDDQNQIIHSNFLSRKNHIKVDDLMNYSYEIKDTFHENPQVVQIDPVQYIYLDLSFKYLTGKDEAVFVIGPLEELGTEFLKHGIRLKRQGNDLWTIQMRISIERVIQCEGILTFMFIKSFYYKRDENNQLELGKTGSFQIDEQSIISWDEEYNNSSSNLTNFIPFNFKIEQNNQNTSFQPNPINIFSSSQQSSSIASNQTVSQNYNSSNSQSSNNSYSSKRKQYFQTVKENIRTQNTLRANQSNSFSYNSQQQISSQKGNFFQSYSQSGRGAGSGGGFGSGGGGRSSSSYYYSGSSNASSNQYSNVSGGSQNHQSYNSFSSSSHNLINNSTSYERQSQFNQKSPMISSSSYNHPSYSKEYFSQFNFKSSYINNSINSNLFQQPNYYYDIKNVNNQNLNKSEISLIENDVDDIVKKLTDGKEQIKESLQNITQIDEKLNQLPTQGQDITKKILFLDLALVSQRFIQSLDKQDKQINSIDISNTFLDLIYSYINLESKDDQILLHSILHLINQFFQQLSNDERQQFKHIEEQISVDFKEHSSFDVNIIEQYRIYQALKLIFEINFLDFESNMKLKGFTESEKQSEFIKNKFLMLITMLYSQRINQSQVIPEFLKKAQKTTFSTISSQKSTFTLKNIKKIKEDLEDEKMELYQKQSDLEEELKQQEKKLIEKCEKIGETEVIGMVQFKFDLNKLRKQLEQNASIFKIKAKLNDESQFKQPDNIIDQIYDNGSMVKGRDNLNNTYLETEITIQKIDGINKDEKENEGVKEQQLLEEFEKQKKEQEEKQKEQQQENEEQEQLQKIEVQKKQQELLEKIKKEQEEARIREEILKKQLLEKQEQEQLKKIEEQKKQQDELEKQIKEKEEQLKKQQLEKQEQEQLKRIEEQKKQQEEIRRIQLEEQQKKAQQLVINNSINSQLKYSFQKSKFAKSSNIIEHGNQIFENVLNEESAIIGTQFFNSGVHTLKFQFLALPSNPKELDHFYVALCNNTTRQYDPMWACLQCEDTFIQGSSQFGPTLRTGTVITVKMDFNSNCFSINEHYYGKSLSQTRSSNLTGQNLAFSICWGHAGRNPGKIKVIILSCD